MSAMSELHLSREGLDEEIARAEVYGLLAQLYHAPPAPELMANMRLAVTEAPVAGGYLEEPWRQLVGAARAWTDAQIVDEHDALFGGVGKPEVLLFASHHLSGHLNDKPLVQLRGDLARLGLTRDEAAAETEDHIAYLCEVMRYLIAGDDLALANLTQQQRFFAAHLQPWVNSLCDELAAHPAAHFYRAVAVFTQAFIDVEAQGFDMLAPGS